MINIGIGVSWNNGNNRYNVIDLIIIAFRERALADGGTFEASGCLNGTLTFLNSIFSALSIVKLFQDRVAADSGSYEAQDCQVTFINNLNNI